MSIRRYREDDPRTAEEVAASIEQELQQINSSAPVVRGTQNYAYINSFATTIAEQQEQALAQLYDVAFLTDSSGEELTKNAAEIGVNRKSAVAATGVVHFKRSSEASQDYVIPSGVTVGTGGDDNISFDTTEKTKIEGPKTQTDSTNYTTSNTSYVTKTSFTEEVSFIDSLDVSGDLKTTNSSYTAYLRAVDATNGNIIDTWSTTNTSLTSFGPTTYDTSALEDEITIEFRLRISNSSGTAEMDNAEVAADGETGAAANIRCQQKGTEGNVGADTITVLIEKPSGVDSVTNPNPTGDLAYTLTDDQTAQTPGRERESDAELRERALSSTAIGGAGTAEATELALENLDDVISADVFTNRSDTTTNGVDPWHTEVRVYGGDINEIALELYRVLPIATIKSLQGGANGTKESTTIEVSDLYGDLTIPITRPVKVTLEIDIDVVHTSKYAGTSEAKNAIVRYIGGTTTDARTITGLEQGEDVMVNEVENFLEDVRGVDYANVTLVDEDGDGTDDTTTDSDGVPVLAVASNEVATVDAADITVSETAR